MEDFTRVTERENEKRKLSDFVKNVHGDLRKQVQKADGDFHSVWKQHCENSLLLQQYSKSMKELAVIHWGSNNLRRIEWCKDICVKYFYEGGFEKCLQKDCKRILFNLELHQNCLCQSEAESLQLKLMRNDYQVKSDKLLLLDVGSCFNPFQMFPNIFTSVAIDLCPADESVYSCDFLCLNIVNHDQFSAKNTPSSLPSSTLEHSNFLEQLHLSNKGITELPRACFHVIVFCLLLSYLPAKEQRWTCILKAHQLLKPNGLLLIITPDSSHQNKNMNMIKSWKVAIESIGFLRWKYEKDSHTHCMAFRKKEKCGSGCSELLVNPEEMMYIHQDLDSEEFREKDGECKEVYSEESVAEGFEGLPFANM